MRAWILGGLAVAAVHLWVTQPRMPQSSPGEGVLRVAVANMFFGNQTTPLEWSSLIDEVKAHVFIVIEWTPKALSTVGLPDYRVAFSHPPRGPDGTLVLVPQAMRARANLFRRETGQICNNPGAAIQLHHEGRALGLLALHLPPPVARCGESHRKAIKTYFEDVGAGIANKPMGPIAKGDPLIVLGDLNSMPMQGAVRTLEARGFEDAWGRANPLRWGATWGPNGFWPVLRLDYVMVPSEIQVLDGWHIGLPGSDHRGVVVDLKWM